MVLVPCELLFLWEQTMGNAIVPLSSREPFSFTVNELGTLVLLIMVSSSQTRVHVALLMQELVLLFIFSYLMCMCVFK